MSTPAAPSEPVAAPPSTSSTSSVHPPPKPYLSSPSPSPSPCPLRPSPSPLLSLRNPSSPSPPPHPPPPPPQLYPVAVAVAAASHHRALGGVGFPPKPSPRAPPPPPPPPDQSVTVANPAGYIPNASPTAVMNLPAAQARPFLHGVPDHAAAAAAAAMRPPPMQAQQLLPPLAVARPVAAAGGGGGASGVVSLAVPPKGVPAAAAHSKVCPLPTVSSAHDYGNSKERDRSGEDTLMTIHNRKVRILDTESPSLYSLCRDWVRNGVPHESQPNIGSSMQLPKPLPASMIDASILRDDENGDEDGESNHLGSAKELSTRDLLNEHIKRGKKIRARLSKVRRLRIERYKERLTILLPPSLETGRHETA